MAEKENKKNLERGMDIFSECLAAMMYSDDEIREMLSPVDAEEYIKLRDGLVASDASCERVIGGYGNGDEDVLPLAAEDAEIYK